MITTMQCDDSLKCMYKSLSAGPACGVMFIKYLFENRRKPGKLKLKNQITCPNLLCKSVLLHCVFHVCCIITQYHYKFKIIIQFSCNFSHINNIKMLILHIIVFSCSSMCVNQFTEKSEIYQNDPRLTFILH